MIRHMLMLPLFLLVGQGDGDDEFDEFEVYIEINATDGDAGFQGFLDGEAWKRAKVSDPDGDTLFQFKPAGNLRDQGVTETKWESNEPQFNTPGFSLQDLLDKFPEGEYGARAKDARRPPSGEHGRAHARPAGRPRHHFARGRRRDRTRRQQRHRYLGRSDR